MCYHYCLPVNVRLLIREVTKAKEEKNYSVINMKIRTYFAFYCFVFESHILIQAT